MKYRWPRFTVRRLMIAIANLAIGFGAIKWIAEMRTRSAAYWRRAFEFEASTLRSGSMDVTADGRLVNRYDTENDLLHDAWAWRTTAKYRRLSYYPWLVVEPDPPPPQRLAHPRRALELPAQDGALRVSVLDSSPPVWTYLWTWRAEPWK
jgi:hypothetical protein